MSTAGVSKRNIEHLRRQIFFSGDGRDQKQSWKQVNIGVWPSGGSVCCCLLTVSIGFISLVQSSSREVCALFRIIGIITGFACFCGIFLHLFFLCQHHKQNSIYLHTQNKQRNENIFLARHHRAKLVRKQALLMAHLLNVEKILNGA